MAGGILNLVANNNAAQNVWLNSNPQVTFFKKVYRRHTPFAREMVPLFFKNNVDFGKSACLDIVPNGDLLHRMFLTFEIPKMSAGFLNSKNYDIVKAINQINFKDDILYKQIDSCIHNDIIEYQKLMDIISNTHKQYINDQNNALNAIYLLENKPKSQVSITDLNLDSKINNFILETDSYQHIYQNMYQTIKSNKIPDFNLIKIKLMDKIMSYKKNYFSIYELVKIMTMMDKNIISQIPVINSKQVPNILLWSNIFQEIFPHNDIINSFITKNNLSKTDTYLYDKIYHLQNLDKPFSNKSFSNKSFSNKSFSSQTYDHSININKNQLYHDFGPEFYRSLNDYNSVINLLNTLSKTVPIIVIKPFECETEYIYTNKQNTLLTGTKYSTIIDPNYKSKFF
nr:capsid [Mimivirus sp.]